MSNPLLGVLFHWLGGLASASFYVPFRKVRGWSWEIYWLIGGFFSWIFAPWVFAYFRTEDLFGVIAAADSNTLMQCIVHGLLWGLGGLTFGLTMRYLGLSLGMAVALGLCAFFGTIIPPMLKGVFFTEVLPSTHGKIVLLGLAMCLVGIAIVGIGGKRPAASGINLLWCALAGVLWYFQFFFYVMGESQMGEYGFSSWTLHMASIIIFSSLWGFALKEWKGSSRKTLNYVFLGLSCLIGSTMVIGYGNSLV